MLKPIKKLSPIDAAKAEVLAATQALEFERENEKAIAARVEVNRKAEFSAREILAKAHARFAAPANLAELDEATAAISQAELDIRVLEREARPLRGLLESARNATRIAHELVREAQRSQWQVEFDAKRLELQSKFPSRDELLKAFGIWWRAGHTAPRGQQWGTFLAAMIGEQPQEKLDEAYNSIESVGG